MIKYKHHEKKNLFSNNMSKNFVSMRDVLSILIKWIRQLYKLVISKKCIAPYNYLSFILHVSRTAFRMDLGLLSIPLHFLLIGALTVWTDYLMIRIKWIFSFLLIANAFYNYILCSLVSSSYFLHSSCILLLFLI